MASDLQELRIVRRAEVLYLTGLSRPTLYRLIGQGLFPDPVRLSSNGVGWRESELRAWLASRERVSASDTAAAGQGMGAEEGSSSGQKERTQ